MTVLRTISIAFVLALAAGVSWDIGLIGLCFAFSTAAALLTVMVPFIAKDFP